LLLARAIDGIRTCLPLALASKHFPGHGHTTHD
jgi:hypothetical protein